MQYLIIKDFFIQDTKGNVNEFNLWKMNQFVSRDIRSTRDLPLLSFRSRFSLEDTLKEDFDYTNMVR